MFKSTKTILIFASVLLSTAIANIGSSQGQMPLPVYVSPPVAVAVPARRICCRPPQIAAVVPIQATYAAYYAPQVPLVPMSPWPSPTMSAFYVPTAPVTTTYFAPVVTTRPVMTTRRARRFAVPVAPVAIYPGYWLP